LRPIVEERAGERCGGVRGELTLAGTDLELTCQANHLYYPESWIYKDHNYVIS
jgi:hypothetical protein